MVHILNESLVSKWILFSWAQRHYKSITKQNLLYVNPHKNIKQSTNPLSESPVQRTEQGSRKEFSCHTVVFGSLPKMIVVETTQG